MADKIVHTQGQALRALTTVKKEEAPDPKTQVQNKKKKKTK